jgi:hypothetical protein
MLGNRGEITGDPMDIESTVNVGMPYRSAINPRKNDRKNISVMDNLITENASPSAAKFTYNDPFFTPLFHIPTETPSGLQNLDTRQTDYINSIAFGIFNIILNKTLSSFCIFPLGIMSLVIRQDHVVNEMLKVASESGMYYDVKQMSSNTIKSRASVNLITNNICQIFEDNDIRIVEIGLSNVRNQVLGFIQSKKGLALQLSTKWFNECILNVKKSNLNIYRQSFKISQQLNLNDALISLGYIGNNNLHYMQQVLVQMPNNIVSSNTIDLSDVSMFYTRHTPNNVIMLLGRI